MPYGSSGTGTQAHPVSPARAFHFGGVPGAGVDTPPRPERTGTPGRHRACNSARGRGSSGYGTFCFFDRAHRSSLKRTWGGRYPAAPASDPRGPIPGKPTGVPSPQRVLVEGLIARRTCLGPARASSRQAYRCTSPPRVLAAPTGPPLKRTLGDRYPAEHASDPRGPIPGKPTAYLPPRG